MRINVSRVDMNILDSPASTILATSRSAPAWLIQRTTREPCAQMVQWSWYHTAPPKQHRFNPDKCLKTKAMRAGRWE